MPDFIQTETTPGQTITVGNKEITPFSRSLKILIPGFSGGLIWNRPHSLLVQTPDGEEQIFPVVDVTRQILWLLMGISIVSFFSLFIISSRKRK